MNTIAQRRRRCVAWLCAALVGVVSASVAAPAAPPAASASAPHSAREAAASARLAAVRAEIARIAADQRSATAARDALGATLADQAQQLAAAVTAVRASDAAIAAKAAELARLQAQQAALATQLGSQRAALAELLRAAYTLDRGSDLSLLLGDEDLGKTARALAYARYFQHDRVARIHALLSETAQLDATHAAIEAATADLKQQRMQQVAATATLAAARAEQARLLAAANAHLAQQGDRMAALQRDAAALTELLKRLQNVFADIPQQVGKTPPFAQLRGRLAWPVAGKSHAGAGSLASGIVITAKPGTDVHAVAYGRVAWADFMRGYGMLVIIDHGGGWLSLYGGNEAALVEAGDWVQPGQAIATVGSQSATGGAWFGLRHDGQPVPPAGWFGTRR